MLFADGEARPEVYSAATVKDQAKICFSDAVEIVKATEGFHALFCRIQHLYPNNIEAYEALEDEYIRIFGERRFSEYDSFRGSVVTCKKKG